MDRIYDITKRRALHDNLRTVLTLAIVCVIVILSMYGTYRALLNNARDMGLELVRSYVADEERNIAAYNTIVRMGMTYLDEIETEGLTEEELRQKIYHFFEDAAEAAGNPKLDCYAIIDGQLIANKDIDAWNQYDYTKTGWYKKVTAAKGQVVYTNETTDEDQESDMLIAAAISPETGNGVFIHLNRESFVDTHKDLDLPEEGAYYLCDEQGRLLFYDAPFEVDEESMEAYAEALCEKVRNGSIAETGEDIADINGVRRGLYHSQVSNGWISIMTIPHSTLLSGFNQIIGLYIGVFALFLIVMVLLVIRDIRLGRSMIHTSMITRALCNTYYAVYRINLKEGTYEMIKGSREMQKLLRRKGTYDVMMYGFDQVIDAETARELNESFSLEHLRELAAKRVNNYGGDFLRELDGRERWINISFILDDALGKEEAILAFRQIDSEKQKQLKHTRLLEVALAAADMSEQSQKQFFSKMSHEMRTPLNIILGMNELAMREDCTPEKRLDYQQKIEYSGRDLLKLMNYVLEVSRSENGLGQLEQKEFDIYAEFDNCIRDFREQAESEGKQFEVHKDADTRMVAGNPLKLSQVLENVLSNAVQFTQAGDKISVSMRQAGPDNDNYIFIIEDTGIGMSEEFLKRIYEPYSQENRFGDHGMGGNGLGMSIVKSLVTQMDGQIEVTSKAGSGTRVLITLPLKAVAENTEPMQAALGEDWLKNLHVMVVDDNDLNREILCELLEEQGVAVDQAADGKTAVELFEKSELFDIDVIIMDMQMPVMDGCEAAQAIRVLDRADAKWVLIIALTANSFSEDVIQTAQAGMDAHLAKPADIRKVEDTIYKLMIGRATAG